jgi:hypothetical protein
MNTIFSPTLLFDFMHMQFIQDIYKNITWNEVKLINIAKRAKIVPNLNICVCRRYKKFGARGVALGKHPSLRQRGGV